MIWVYDQLRPNPALYAYISLIRSMYRLELRSDEQALSDLWSGYFEGALADESFIRTGTAAISTAGVLRRTRFAAVDFGTQILVAFTGAQALQDWGDLIISYGLTDADLIPGNRWALNGTVFAWQQSYRENVFAFIAAATAGVPVYFVGHSMGGAVACALAAEFKENFLTREVHAITYGTPKFAPDFFWTMNGGVDYLHVQNYDDAITYWPPSESWLATMLLRRIKGLKLVPTPQTYADNRGRVWRLALDGKITNELTGAFVALDANLPSDALLASAAYGGQIRGHYTDEYQRRLRLRFGIADGSVAIDGRANFQNAGDGLNWSIPRPGSGERLPQGIQSPPLPLLQAIERQNLNPNLPVPIDGQQPAGPYLIPPFNPTVQPPPILTPTLPFADLPRPPNAAQAAAAAKCCPFEVNGRLVRPRNV